MMSFRGEWVTKCSSSFHFPITSKKRILRSEVGVKWGRRGGDQKGDLVLQLRGWWRIKMNSRLLCRVPCCVLAKTGKDFPYSSSPAWTLSVFCEYLISKEVVFKLNQLTNYHVPVCKIWITGRHIALFWSPVLPLWPQIFINHHCSSHYTYVGENERCIVIWNWFHFVF